MCDGNRGVEGVCPNSAHMHCVGVEKNPVGGWYCGECNGFMTQQPNRTRRSYNVLSLFDGVGTGWQVLKNLNYCVTGYHAFECDANAIAGASYQHPDIKYYGNVHDLDESPQFAKFFG